MLPECVCGRTNSVASWTLVSSIRFEMQVAVVGVEAFLLGEGGTTHKAGKSIGSDFDIPFSALLQAGAILKITI